VRLLALALLAGCFEPQVIACDNWVCPPGFACGTQTEPCVPLDVICEVSETCAPGSFCKDNRCVEADCGNGVVEPGEVCDDEHCFEECTKPGVCGDLAVTPDEACDDGALVSGDGCSATCEVEQPRWEPVVQLDHGPARSFIAGAFDEARQRFVVFGGTDGGPNGQTLEFDPATNAWFDRTLPSGPLRGYGATMAYDAERRVIMMFGGFNSAGYSNKTWVWDGERWAQQFVAGPPPRAYAKGVWDPTRGTIVMYGGQISGATLRDTWEWNGSAWTKLVDGPVFNRRSVFAWDDDRSEGIAFMPVGETWSWRDGAWSKVDGANTPSTGDDASLTYDRANHQLVLHGLTLTFTWDGARWTQLGGAYVARNRHAEFFDPIRHQVAVVGGYDYSAEPDTYYADIAWLDRATNTWTTVASEAGPIARTGAAMAFDAQREVIYMYGGTGLGATSDDFWIRAHGAWRKVLEQGAAGTRVEAGGAFDRQRNVFVIYGGQTNATTVWEFDGTSWREIDAPGGPGIRLAPGMAYDERSQRVVLFGGRDPAVGYFDDTWSWDGTTWTDVSSGMRPPARYYAELISSATQQELLLFGGTSTTSLGDFWKWDASGWQPIIREVGPEPRTELLLARDPSRGETLLFGGRTSTDARDDTWAWDGNAWMQLEVSQAPPPTSGMTAAYDEVSRTLVMMGRDGVWEMRWETP
jgi:cysteine-rich repeat protein